MKRLPSGEFVEVHERPEREEAMTGHAVHRTELVRPLPRHIIPLPTPGRVTTQVRTRLNRTYTKYQAEVAPEHPDGNGGGNGNGHRDR